jgi:hypothetical protein
MTATNNTAVAAWTVIAFKAGLSSKRYVQTNEHYFDEDSCENGLTDEAGNINPELIRPISKETLECDPRVVEDVIRDLTNSYSAQIIAEGRRHVCAEEQEEATRELTLGSFSRIFTGITKPLKRFAQAAAL